MNGYAKMHPVGISARADALEIVVGYPDAERVDRELSVAISSIDPNDTETYRWLACLISRKIDELEAGEEVGWVVASPGDVLPAQLIALIKESGSDNYTMTRYHCKTECIEAVIWSDDERKIRVSANGTITTVS